MSRMLVKSSCFSHPQGVFFLLSASTHLLYFVSKKYIFEAEEEGERGEREVILIAIVIIDKCQNVALPKIFSQFEFLLLLLLRVCQILWLGH